MRFRAGRNRLSAFLQAQPLDRWSAGWRRQRRGSRSPCSLRTGRISLKATGLTVTTSPLYAGRWLFPSHWRPLPGVWFARLQRVRRLAPWLAVLALFFAAWEAVTAKLGLLPLPFFPPPQAILEVMVDDRTRLVACVLASFRLLATGYFLGAAVGFVTGVAIG